MKGNASLTPVETGQARLVVIIAVLILVPLGFSVVSQVASNTPESSTDFLERPDPKYEECIREASYMRFHHWEHLREVREEVVRFGIRNKVDLNGISVETGLSGCPECHKSRERFCDQCHNAASVIPDCFGCHYYP